MPAAKIEAVEELVEHLGKSAAAVLVEYRGLNVAQMTELRKRMREAGVHFKVYKNTLISRAAQAVGLGGLSAYLEGPTAVVVSPVDPVLAAKLVVELQKKMEPLKIKAGVLEGKVLSAEETEALAKLPSREELIAKVVGSFKSPLYRIAGVLGNIVHTPLRNFMHGLKAVAEQKG
ncbi:MAG: 50S ribosomal protein L10 [Hydrogenibacillus sp.]|nr:50S ribosomal protein L10 [Hydrogenibacillus sp.]